MISSNVRFVALATVLVFGLTAASQSALAGELSEADRAEINQLISAIEHSDCTFIRNSSEHDAKTAASHLRLKLKRGGKYISDSEGFIDRLASKSSWSGKPYHIQCPSLPKMTSGQWLTEKLIALRENPVS